MLFNPATKEVVMGEFDASDEYETVCSFGDYEFPGPSKAMKESEFTTAAAGSNNKDALL